MSASASPGGRILISSGVVRLDRTQRGWSAALFALGSTGLWLLWHAHPTGYSFIPACYFHALTGLECPGCGGLRGTHYMLQGQFSTAWAYNPLAMLLMPIMVAFYLNFFTGMALGRQWRCRLRHWVWVVIVAVILGYWVLRNLPWACFDGWRPPRPVAASVIF